MKSRLQNARRKLTAIAAMTLVLSLLAPTRAHNVAVVHPEITDVAMEALRQADITTNGASGGLTDPCPECSYNQLWDHRGVLDPPATGWESAANYHTAFNAGTASVMIGIVVEDGVDTASEARVVNHFYHALTGVGLLDEFNSSQTRAQELFLYGLSLHDYTDQSQDRSYIYAGRFLHHVEDMSSPAHVHNDAHLYYGWFETDMDDYEGRFVPGTVWNGGTLRAQLTAPAPSPRFVDSANDIWSAPVAGVPQVNATPPDDSLSGYVFNRSTYWATLQYPQNGTPPPNPTGELAQMFPGEPADPADDGLNWVSPMIGFDRWEIDGVGEYHYKASWASEDDWWPDAAANERSAGDPNGVLAPYYLEQLMTGDTAATALQPERIRQTFVLPWNAATNPVVQNTVCLGGPTPGAACSRDANCSPGLCEGDSIVELQAGSLLQPAAEYVAGAAQWWFRYANLPPYLKKCEATQASTVKYLASWDDPTPVVEEDRVLAEVGFDTTETIEVVNERAFNHLSTNRVYINALDDLTLKLEFNEPIREISELKLLDAGGADVIDVKALVMSQGGAPVKTMDDTIWTYTIQAAGLDGLNGELTLKVMAQDLNAHTEDGGELDATPNSPAKRNLTGAIDLRAPAIPWHTEMSDDRFVYDFTTGDRNHRLLFDTVKPVTSIGVTP